MGNKSNEELATFGEIIFKENMDGKILLPCSVTSPCKLEIIVQDKDGGAVIHENMEVTESTTVIELDGTPLVTGQYHAWIYYDGKIALRAFTIQNKPPTGNFGRFLALFS